MATNAKKLCCWVHKACWQCKLDAISKMSIESLSMICKPANKSINTPSARYSVNLLRIMPTDRQRIHTIQPMWSQVLATWEHAVEQSVRLTSLQLQQNPHSNWTGHALSLQKVEPWQCNICGAPTDCTPRQQNEHNPPQHTTAAKHMRISVVLWQVSMLLLNSKSMLYTQRQFYWQCAWSVPGKATATLPVEWQYIWMLNVYGSGKTPAHSDTYLIREYYMKWSRKCIWVTSCNVCGSKGSQLTGSQIWFPQPHMQAAKPRC